MASMRYELSRDDAGKIREPGKLVRIQQTYADRILSYIHWLPSVRCYVENSCH